MRNYDRVHPKKPEGIENRKAYIIGGGIAGLSAAAFLVRDAQMPGENIIVYDQLPVFGGSMDACGNAKTGYISRGERELEPYMECLWDLFSTIPSLYEEGRTVLDETRECNKNWEINSTHRLWEKGFVPHDESSMGLSSAVQEQMVKMMLTPEEELENVTIEQWFSKDFFESNLWYYWSSMLAFQPYESLIEMRRYAVRFMHQLHLIKSLKQILRTKYDQYHSLILPLQKYLTDNGVRFAAGTTVTDIELDIQEKNKTVTALKMTADGKEAVQPIAKEDMVFFTNGSMSQNSAFGDNYTVAITNRDTEHRGVFTVWEKLAKLDPKFGRPEVFISDIDKTKWLSFFPTITDFPEFYSRIQEKSGRPIGETGVISFPESNWDISYIPYHAPYFPNQPENVQVGWGYGLWGERPGNYITKPMCDCTGDEILTEMLYHFGMLDLKDGLLSHTYVSTCMMPYITSQFMPRHISDRPKVVPEGCTNLAFIGQYVETLEDAVFTVETSCRTGMYAAYALSGVEKKPLEVAPTFYDLRYIIGQLKKIQNIDGPITKKDLPKINPLKLRETEKDMLNLANRIEKYPSLYPGKEKFQ